MICYELIGFHSHLWAYSSMQEWQLNGVLSCIPKQASVSKPIFLQIAHPLTIVSLRWLLVLRVANTLLLISRDDCLRDMVAVMEDNNLCPHSKSFNASSKHNIHKIEWKAA